MFLTPFIGLANSTEQVSAAQTAMATWWLVVVTFLAALGTVAAVIVALAASRSEGRRRSQERRQRDRAAVDAVGASREYVQEVCNRRHEPAPPMDERSLWTILGRLSSDRKVLDHFLSTPLWNPDLPKTIAESLQRNFEVRDAISGLLPKEHGPGWRNISDLTLGSASDRMENGKEAFEALKTQVNKS